jgi:hypothetical protein
MNKAEALAFIAALARGYDDSLYSREADDLMDEMGVSEDLRELVVADVLGGQYTCDDCYPTGCEYVLRDGSRTTQRCEDNVTWREKETTAHDVWQGPISRISLIQDIARAAITQAGMAWPDEDSTLDRCPHFDTIAQARAYISTAIGKLT